MQELLEMIEDLETIQTLTSHPALEETIERILEKYEVRKIELEEDMERQYEMEFAGVTRLLDKRWEKV
jgi:L-lactate utilization protein LutC